jgi:predicted transposase YdaD
MIDVILWLVVALDSIEGATPLLACSLICSCFGGGPLAKTDHLLKQLVAAFRQDFASWLLHVEVKEVTPRNVELLPSTDPIRSDEVFFVTTAEGKKAILHIEFQGARSRTPMPLRQLEYLVRLSNEYPSLPLHSVVIYVGKGAGKGDSGEYRVPRLDGKSALTWRYEVIRLWEMGAEELLATGKLALLPLIGQTRIGNPSAVLSEVLERVKNVPDADIRERLLMAMGLLMEDKEVLAMLELLERIIRDDELQLDTPLMQRLREAREEGLSLGREEGLSLGREEGLSLGREEGLSLGREEGLSLGTLATLRRNILDAVMVRFSPTEQERSQIEATLATITDETRLRDVFQIALRAESLTPLLQERMGQNQNGDPAEQGKG